MLVAVHRSLPCLVAAVLTGLTGAACTAERQPAAESGCAATVRQASLAVEVEEQVALLDDALVRCTSLDDLTREIERYPGIIGYGLTTFLELRCGRTPDTAARASAACSTVTPPSTTVPDEPEELLYVGDTLDGRRIEIRPDADTVFIGTYPRAIQETVDIAIADGCPGVFAQRELWARRTSDPEIGDEASVYARHAEIVAAYLGCESTPTTSVPTT